MTSLFLLLAPSMCLLQVGAQPGTLINKWNRENQKGVKNENALVPLNRAGIKKRLRVFSIILFVGRLVFDLIFINSC